MRVNKENLENTVFSAYKKIKILPPYQKLAQYADVDRVLDIAYKKLGEFQNNAYNDPEHDMCVRQANFVEKTVALQKENLKNFQMANDINWLFEESQMMSEMNVSALYYCCPSCKHFSQRGDWIVPISGWDGILRKYASDIFARILLCNGSYGYERIGYISTPKDDIFTSITRANDKLAKREAAQGLTFYSYDVSKEEFKLTQNGSVMLKCPHCGKEFESRENKFGYAVSFNNEKYAVRRLVRSCPRPGDNEFLVNYEIYSDKEDIVSISAIYWVIYPNVDGMAHVTHVNRRISMNTKTGQTYLFRDYDLKKKKPMLYDKDTPRLRNTTYAGTTAWWITREMMEAAINEICKKKGVNLNLENLYPIRQHYLDFDILVMTNRYAEYGEDFLIGMLSIQENLSVRVKRNLFKMRTDHSIFERYLRKYKITGKRYKKIMAQNPYLFFTEQALTEFGFKNHDVKMSLLQDMTASCVLTDYFFSLRKKTLDAYGENKIRQMRDFVCDYAQIKSEAELARKLKDVMENSFFRDIVGWYADIKDMIDLTVEDKKQIFSGSLLDTHDFLCQINHEINFKREHFFIPYTKEELSVNCRCGDYYFVLAKTTKELVEVGDSMHICVGSYYEYVLKKESKIVTMHESDGKLAACIELDPTGKQLIQFKDYCNGRIEASKVPAAVRFLMENGIEYRSCFDAIESGFIDTDMTEGYDLLSFDRMESTDGYKIFDSKNDFQRVPIEPKKEEGNDLLSRYKKAVTEKMNDPNHNDVLWF